MQIFWQLPGVKVLNALGPFCLWQWFWTNWLSFLYSSTFWRPLISEELLLCIYVFSPIFYLSCLVLCNYSSAMFLCKIYFSAHLDILIFQAICENWQGLGHGQVEDNHNIGALAIPHNLL